MPVRVLFRICRLRRGVDIARWEGGWQGGAQQSLQHDPLLLTRSSWPSYQ
jgi:hypothetical protein